MAAKLEPSIAQSVIDTLIQRKLTIATAESCTGGLIAGALTDIPGSSAAFFGGYVTYDNAAKSAMIGVPARMIGDYGAVSAQVARAMADGARSTARTALAVASTGIAGPGGGSDRKPVGLVYLAVATISGTQVVEKRFGSLSRGEIRALSVAAALQLVLDTLDRPME
ncbi:MAG TPA: nicotinamide-nucleotide amidohydrolase family protein [Devosiaceae bacterium]|jgi:nicotinamide-nucleotide amidase